MIFTSFEFIAFFLIVLIGYYLIFPNLRWIWLLAASFYFYTKASPHFLPYILSSVAVIYASSRMIGYLDSRKASYFQKNELTKDEKKAYNKRCTRNKKIFCAAGIILNVGMLAFTKYFNFVGESVSAITGGTFTALDIIVPLGISFYTFQSTGYLIDVYRGMYEPQKNPMKYALFILFFPQIMQGPIGRYNDLAPQLFEPCKFDYDRLKSGLVRMLWGFFKKMVIADRAALLVNTVFDNWKPYSGAVIWAAVFLYAVQLYADFSGYMDIALGAGEALGIRLSENFRTPYFSKSTAEFWRRWHITLGTWFRDYLFYPIIRTKLFQKVAKSKKLPKFVKTNLPTIAGLAVVWLITGIWHGADWHYAAWGIYYGMIIIASSLLAPVYEKLTKLLKIKTDCFSYKLFQIARTFLIVLVGYVLFRGNGLMAAFKMIKSMFTVYNPWVFTDGTLMTLGLDAANWNVLILSMLIILAVSVANENGINVREKIAQQNIIFQWICYLAGIFAVLIFGIYGSGYDASAFMYLNF